MKSAQSILASVLAAPVVPPAVAVAIGTAETVDVAVHGQTWPGGTDVTADHLFDLASITKAVGTTAMLHRLAALGELRLDDPVTRFLPQGPAAGASLDQLARHRSGLWEWQPLYLTGRGPREAIADLPLRYGRDQARHYSDLGFMVLGEVVAAVTGDSLPGALERLVTGPLDLDDLGYNPGPDRTVAAAHGDTVERMMVATGEPYPVLFPDAGFAWREHLLVGDVADGNAFHAWGGVSGHAGLFGSVKAVFAVCASLAAADEGLWGGSLAAQVFAAGPDSEQAFGWRRLPIVLDGRPRTLIYHPGHTGGAAGFVPGTGLAVVMLTNRLLAGAAVTTDELWRRALAGAGLIAPDEGGQAVVR